MPADNVNPTYFVRESDFETALCELLPRHGWTEEVIMNPTEDDLIRNWADIIYSNNREQHRLGNYPLTESEMRQVITQFENAATPYAINKLIKGGEICIRRDNQADTENYGQDVYLKIFGAHEICAGQSRYQIVRQPRFRGADESNRRGDVMLLINGMPLIHIELKRSKVDVSQAVFQIKRYMHEGIFSRGIWSMVQIFVAMTPDKTLYFANPGSEDRFNSEFQFHWADFNNEEEREWYRVAQDLLNIPMAHQLIGYYTVADDQEEVLKVLRSYQYFAVINIRSAIEHTDWDMHNHRGGFIWHTTGSGKTLTSFKTAQLVAQTGQADKVIFLMDRIELSTQSSDEFRSFSDDPSDIQDPRNTATLLARLLDNDSKLIVTSIQKMSNINTAKGVPQETLDRINRKRLVVIVDECHRSVFGKMLVDIKDSFSRALLFGFTGTPIFEENAKNEIMTSTLFGDMLHKYTLRNAIPDGNVRGFDPTMVNTYNEMELREKAALHYLKADDISEIEGDPRKMEIYNRFIDELEMASDYNDPSTGRLTHGIEYYLPTDLYQQNIHHLAVANDIACSREELSHDYKFHAMLAVQNIPEAVEYYHIFKEQHPSLNVVAVFDNNIDNSDEGIAREDQIKEMIDEYNQKYKTSFRPEQYDKYKKDVAKRLAHKHPYSHIELNHDEQIDLLIVVTQMLTGYDSKWVNTLYVDKTLEYVNLIQAFSRTNRNFGPEKPFGIIRYYTFPWTMKQNIEDALEVYADGSMTPFVDKLEVNLESINRYFMHICDIFRSQEIENFERLPETREDRNMFAKDFIKITHLLEAVKLQEFKWEKRDYTFLHGDTVTTLHVDLDERTYRVLLQRYRELFTGSGSGGTDPHEFDYPVDTFITEIGTGTIDAEYVNSNFRKYLRELFATGPGSELTVKALQNLHKSFASMSQRDQRTAAVILSDIQSGKLRLEKGKTIQDYITLYQRNELEHQIREFSEAIGVNAFMLKKLIESKPSEQNINEFNRLGNLRSTVNPTQAKIFIEKVENRNIPDRMVLIKAENYLKRFILKPQDRQPIIDAWLGIHTLESTEIRTEETVDDTFRRLENPQPSASAELGNDEIIEGIKRIITTSLSGVARYMRSPEEVAKSVMNVIDATSISSLDGMRPLLHRAFTNIFKPGANNIDKSVAFNILSTQFEAFLKKLYYLINHCEIQPSEPGQNVSWRDAVKAFSCLWGLRNNPIEGYKKLSQKLELAKSWRNDQSHISPTSTEEELDFGLNVLISLYAFVAGSNITEIEMSEGASAANIGNRRRRPRIQRFIPETMLTSSGLAAEPTAKDLPVESRDEILKKCINQLLGYTPENSPLVKQRNWEAIYRIAADYGFTIDGDYKDFITVVKRMNITAIPSRINSDILSRLNTGVYAKDFREWSSEGLRGRKLTEYQDIQACAERFRDIVKQNLAAIGRI